MPMGDYLHLAFSTCDQEGQFGPHFAVPVKFARVSPPVFGGEGETPTMHIDIVHMDDERERLELVLMKRKPFFLVGHFDGKTGGAVCDFQVATYSSGTILTKDEWRKTVGTGRLLNSRGHFVPADEV